MTSAANVGSGGGVYTWHFSYDLMGRANQQTLQTPWGPANYYPPQVAKAQYTYDSDGKLTSMNYPGNLAGTAAAGAAYQYTYDAVGRATGVNSWDSGNQVWDPVAANGAYNAAGQILGWQEYASGYAYSMSRSYDPARGWLNSLSANSGYGLNMSYTYNANGQATVLTDSVNGGQSVTSYSYDSLNRLSGVIANNWTMAWSYDAFGNRQTQTGTPSTGANAVPTSSLTYNPNTNQIWQGNYSYDANGNMTQMPGPSSTVDSMQYDVFDRLAGLQNSNNQSGSSYSYDAFGRRIAKLLPSGGVKVYFYGMRGQSLGEYDFTPSGTTGLYPIGLSLPNVYFAGQRVNQWTDRTGSKRKDNTNTNSHYYPYGEEITSTSNDTYKFAQTYRDSDSGLDYAVNRYYASGIGRFLTPDPYKADSPGSGYAPVPESWNRYTYSQGDPVNLSDPQGLFLACGIGYYPFAGECQAMGNASWWDMSGMPGVFTSFINVSDPTAGVPAAAQKGAETIKNAERAAGDKLFSQDCAGLFLIPALNTPQNRAALSNQLDSIEDNGSIREISPASGADPTVPGFTTDAGGLIYFFAGGAFFTGQVNGNPIGGWASGMTLSDIQQLMVIHEFMHWMNIVGPDSAGQQYVLPNGDTVSGSQGISQEVRKKCFGY